MLGQQFYHETIRKIIVSFGTIFNNIQIVRKNSSGNITQSMKVHMGLNKSFLHELEKMQVLVKQLRLLYLELHLRYKHFLMIQLEN